MTKTIEEFGLPQRTLNTMRAIFAQYSEIEKVVIYGSRAVGNYRKGSDIDLTLYGEYADSIPFQTLSDISGDLDDSDIPYQVDLSICDALNHAKLREQIERVGQVFYQKEDSVAAGWETVTLADVCEIYGGGTPKSKIEEYWGDEIQWLTPKDMGKLNSRFVTSTERQISQKGLEKSSAKLISENAVILSCRAPIGYLAINKVPMSFNQGCKGLVPNKKIDTTYLFYFLLSARELLNDLGAGTTFKEISSKVLSGVELSLPPLPLQKQIVEKLDATFAEIDKAISATSKNIENAEALFTKHHDNILSKQGKNWQTQKLQDVCEHITDGTHQTPKYFDDGYIFLSSRNVKRKKVDWENIKYIDESQHQAMQKRLSPRLGDILLAKNGTTGVAALVDRDVVFDIYVSLALVRSKGAVLPKYLLEAINCSETKKQFDKRLKGTGVPNLHLKEIREVKVSFPDALEEQGIVLNRIKLFESYIILLKEKYFLRIENLAALKSSILTQAFSGELTRDAA